MCKFRPMVCRSLMIAAPALALGWSAPALAAVSAEDLQSEIQSGIASLLNKPGYAEVLQFDGEVEVEPSEGGAFRVAMPPLRIGPSNNLAGLNLGQIVFFVTENTDRYYDIEMQVGDEFQLQTETGQVYATMALDPVRASASRWDRELGMLIYTDTTAASFKFSSRAEQFAITMENIDIDLNFVLKGGNLYDGLVSAKADAVSYASRRTDVAWSIGELAISSEVTDINLATYMETMPVLDRLAEALEIPMPQTNDPQTLRDMATQADAERRAATRAVFDAMTAPNVLGNDSFLDVSLADIRASVPSAGTTFNISSMGLRLSYGGLAGDRSRYAVQFSHTGLALDTAALPAMSDLILPQDMALELSLSDVPSARVWRYLQDLSQISEPLTERQAAAKVQELQEALATAPARIELNRLLFSPADPGPTIEGSGSLTITDNKDVPLVGSVEVRTVGMDEVGGALARERANPIFAQLALAVNAINVFGEKLDAAGEDGRSVRRYAVEFAPDGTATLNGRDISQLRQILMR